VCHRDGDRSLAADAVGILEEAEGMRRRMQDVPTIIRAIRCVIKLTELMTQLE
jgi:hypothetical protein